MNEERTNSLEKDMAPYLKKEPDPRESKEPFDSQQDEAQPHGPAEESTAPTAQAGAWQTYGNGQTNRGTYSGAGQSGYQPGSHPVYAPQKTRRVGTFTMGLTLIAAGCVFLANFFVPDFDFGYVMRFSPVILILLGIEIVVSHFLFRSERFKYDFVSALFCFLIVTACAGMISMGTFLSYWGPQQYEAENILSSRAEELCYKQLGGDPAIASLEVYVSINRPIPWENLNNDIDFSSGDSVHVSLELAGDFTDTAGFVAECRRILDGLEATELPFGHVSFRCETSVGDEYFLYLDNRFQLSLPLERLVEMIEVYREEEDAYWDDDSPYVDEGSSPSSEAAIDTSEALEIETAT